MSEVMAFQVNGLKKRFGIFELRIDELALPRGYVLGLLGPNGAGKSTLIKSLLNLVYPDAGRVQVLGLEQPRHETEIKRRVGYVSELPSYYPDMSVGWTVDFVSRYYPTWDPVLAQRYLTMFGLDPSKLVKELSRGMQVKLALTLALSHKPDLLILDEPTSGLDPLVRAELLEEIAAVLQDEHRSVLFSSHITQDVEQVADYVAIVGDGRLVDFAEKEDLLARWKRIRGTVPSSVASSAGGNDVREMFREYRTDGQRFNAVTDRFSDAWRNELLAHGYTDIHVANMTLDEIFAVQLGHRSRADRMADTIRS